MSSKTNEKLSKTMCYLLRHGAEKEGITMNGDGFVDINNLLEHKDMKQFSVKQIIKVVEKCPKQRFFINIQRNSKGKEEIFIRANQGHSIENVKIDMSEILVNTPSLEEYKNNVYHGTYYKCWDKIKEEGLSRMNRQHIHFAIIGSINESGMRHNCQIKIFINIENALKDGIKFYKSSNNVILSPGNDNGYLLPKYFDKVIDIKTREQL